MIFQTSDGFPVTIRKYGCYLLSLSYHLNRLFGKPSMTIGGIMELYSHESGDGDIGNEAFIQNPQGICDYIAPGKIRFIGGREAPYRCGHDEFEILRFYNVRTEFHHFVAGDGSGKVAYDPIEGGSVTVREGHCDGKRIFKLI